MEPVETIKYRGREINIFQDEDPMNPREEFDNIGQIVHWHRRYDFGERIDDPEEWLAENENDCIILPLYLYDHSGITINCTGFSCGWDSGQVGFIYMTKEDAIEGWGEKICSKKVREKAILCLKSEVKTYDQYLRGEVYGYDTGNDSCCGYYGGEYDKEDGSWDYMISEAKGAIDWDINNERQAHFKGLKAQIKNHVPLRLRKPMAA